MRSPILLFLAAFSLAACQKDQLLTASTDATTADHRDGPSAGQDKVDDDLAEQGRQTFRFDTFGDEDFWGGALHLHDAIQGASHGGVGPGVSPKTALAVGLKVDVDALPPAVQKAIAAGQVDLDSPDTTLALLDLNAVIGVTGFKDGNGGLKSIGIQCEICHSAVDNSFAPGIGHRLDGWPNRDLDPAYQKLDLSASYRVHPRVSLYTSIENILDKRYDASFGFPSLPRAVRAGARITLGGD